MADSGPSSVASAAPSSSSAAGGPAPSLPAPAELARLVARARRTVADCAPDLLGDDVRTGGPSEGSGRLRQSCSACVKLKARCSGAPGRTCERCVNKGIECVYGEQKKMGRKVSSRNKLKLLELKQDLDRLHDLLHPSPLPARPPSLAPSTTTPIAPSSSSPQLVPPPASAGDTDSHKHEDDPELTSVLTNPLSLLTLADEEVPPLAGAPLPAPAPSLFDHVLDADATLDPVYLGLISEDVFERLLKLYSDNQQLYLYLLDPALHTSHFLRRTSPFLTTVIALAAAPFAPFAAHLVQGLEVHARRLSARAFIDGFKSMEVVLAYLLYSPWSSAVDRPSDDRTWRHVSQAVRFAGEIRLDLPLQPHLVRQYQDLVAPAPVSTEALEATRSRVHEAVFAINLALSVQTGRLVHVIAMVGPEDGPLGRTPEPAATSPEAFEIARLHTANLALAHYFARALTFHARLRRKSPSSPSNLQETFNASWQADFAQWDRDYASLKGFPYLSRLFRSVLLLSYSLHFPGPTGPIFGECQRLALDGARYVKQWFAEDPRLLYASNSFVVNMAYCPLYFLRHVLGHCRQGSPAKSQDEAVELGWEIVRIFDCIAAARLHGRSVATVYANQLRTLLTQLQHYSSLSLPTPPSVASTGKPDPSGFTPATFDPLVFPLSATPFPSAASTSFAEPSWTLGPEPATLEGYHDALFSSWFPGSVGVWGVCEEGLGAEAGGRM